MFLCALPGCYLVLTHPSIALMPRLGPHPPPTFHAVNQPCTMSHLHEFKGFLRSTLLRMLLCQRAQKEAEQLTAPDYVGLFEQCMV